MLMQLLFSIIKSCLNENEIKCYSKTELSACYEEEVVVSCNGVEECYQLDRDAVCLAPYKPKCKPGLFLCHPSMRGIINCKQSGWTYTSCNTKICTNSNNTAVCTDEILYKYCQAGEIKCLNNTHVKKCGNDRKYKIEECSNCTCKN